MSVTNVEKDLASLTMKVMADLDATVERVWQLWADPRQFEQWWGPPGHPVTVVDHDLRTGGRITFFMTGTEGNRQHSTWEVIAANPPRHLELRDADVDEDVLESRWGTPDENYVSHVQDLILGCPNPLDSISSRRR